MKAQLVKSYESIDKLPCNGKYFSGVIFRNILIVIFGKRIIIATG